MRRYLLSVAIQNILPIRCECLSPGNCHPRRRECVDTVTWQAVRKSAGKTRPSHYFSIGSPQLGPPLSGMWIPPILDKRSPKQIKEDSVLIQCKFKKCMH
ncbi:hypothetical protein CEXT_576471 [Caerostris extrusa]|uniref:Uncharacterized protein n=1 Tax=Caerostris extrusa TaxID=172846 RepID=A0AAV4VX29_CAEEX|nr:hypothetical protein CEXT_576471 [Caerostris extrusa]